MNRNITALLLVAIAIAIYFTYTQGQLDKDYAINADNGEYTTAISNANTLTTVRASVEKSFNNISADESAQLDKMIPSSADNIHLIVDISKLASESYGFALRNIKADIVQGSDTTNGSTAAVSASSGSKALLTNSSLSKIKLTFDTTAEYGRFISFMQALEKSLRIMDVTKLSVKANDTGIYDFSVEITTYWLKQ